MAETTPNQSEPTENKNADAPKATSGLPPKSPPPPGAGGPPKAPPPPGAGGPPKAPPPPGASAPAAGGPPKAPAPPMAGGPPRTPPPPAAGGPPKTPAPPAAGGPPKAPPPVVPNISNADNPLGQVPRPPKTPASAGTAAAPKPATTVSGSAAAAPATTTGTESTVTRREFLNYVWGASMALFLVQFGGLSFFFALPRARLGEFGGIIPVGVQQFIDAATQKVPIANNAGKFWIVNTEQGINALYKVCTHLGCIYPWSDASNIFACPCHGSQFHINGDWIAGPAPRSLDRFVMQVQDASGATIAESADGQPIVLPANAATILVDTGKKVTGKSHL